MRSFFEGFALLLATAIGAAVRRLSSYGTDLPATAFAFLADLLVNDHLVQGRFAFTGKRYALLLADRDLDQGSAGQEKSIDAAGVEHAFWRKLYLDRGFRDVSLEAFRIASAAGEMPKGLGVRVDEYIPMRESLRPTLPPSDPAAVERLIAGERSVEEAQPVPPELDPEEQAEWDFYVKFCSEGGPARPSQFPQTLEGMQPATPPWEEERSAAV